jgi:glycine/D-amino acid oxidase-like deaminating enzyme
MERKVKTKYDAIIIGSGIIGCSIAFELSKKGWKTLNVDNILKQDNRIKGVELEDATVIEAPVVVNASGPHSFIINRLAGVEEGMQIKTRALRHEVVHLPAPSDVDYESIGCPSSDSDIGGYWRPEIGNNILSGSEDPECDPKEWVENPVVFRLKHLKRDISLKFYSRLREINKESSFSVLG